MPALRSNGRNCLPARTSPFSISATGRSDQAEQAPQSQRRREFGFGMMVMPLVPRRRRHLAISQQLKTFKSPVRTEVRTCVEPELGISGKREVARVYFKGTCQQNSQSNAPVTRDPTARRSGGSRWPNLVVRAPIPNTARFTSRFKSVSPASSPRESVSLQPLETRAACMASRFCILLGNDVCPRRRFQLSTQKVPSLGRNCPKRVVWDRGWGVGV